MVTTSNCLIIVTLCDRTNSTINVIIGCGGVSRPRAAVPFKRPRSTSQTVPAVHFFTFELFSRRWRGSIKRSPLLPTELCVAPFELNCV